MTIDYRYPDVTYVLSYRSPKITKAEQWELERFEWAIRQFERARSIDAVFVYSMTDDEVRMFDSLRVLDRDYALTEEEVREHYHKLRTAYEANKSLERHSV